MIKYTTRGMPVVSQFTLDSILGRYAGRKNSEGADWGSYLTEVQRRIIEEDPVLTKFLEMQVGKFPRELHNSMFELLLGLYAVLETQTEINKLEE